MYNLDIHSSSHGLVGPLSPKVLFFKLLSVCQFYAPYFLVSVKLLPFLEHAGRACGTHPHSKIALVLQNISAVAARPDKKEESYHGDATPSK